MNWHKNCSYIKSFLRMVACACLALGYIPLAAYFLFVAETIGVIEEWGE